MIHVERLKKSTKQVFLTLTVIWFVGCSTAKSVDQIQATYIPVGTYRGYSCDELVIEADRIISSIPTLSQAVEREYRGDKSVELVSWVLFWPAAFALDGNEKEARDLANAKGRLEAIDSRMKLDNC